MNDASAVDRQHVVKLDMESRTVDFVDVERSLYTDDDPYWIGFDRLNSVEDFMEWLRHIGRKKWCTVQHLTNFATRYEFLVRNGEVSEAFFSKGRPIEKRD